MRKVTSWCATVVAFLAVLSLAAPSGASLVGAKCTAGKFKAAGKKASGKLKCHQKAANAGGPVDGSCLSLQEQKFDSGFAGAEASPPCFATGDAPTIEAKIDTFVGSVVGDLRPSQTASKCTARELSAAAKKAEGKLKCHEKASTKGIVVDPLCLTKAEGKFTKSFAAAVTKGDCVSGTAGATIEATIDAFVADAAGTLRPGPLSVCTGMKLDHTGQKTLDKLRCHSVAAKNGVAVDADCLTKAETKFGSAFAKDEASNDCLMPPGDTAVIEAKVDAFVTDIVTTLRPALTTSKCASNKLLETGKEPNKKLTCRSRSIRHGLPGSPDCLTPADLSHFVKDDTLADCLTTGDQATIEAKVDAFLADVVAALLGP